MSKPAQVLVLKPSAELKFQGLCFDTIATLLTTPPSSALSRKLYC